MRLAASGVASLGRVLNIASPDHPPVLGVKERFPRIVGLSSRFQAPLPPLVEASPRGQAFKDLISDSSVPTPNSLLARELAGLQSPDSRANIQTWRFLGRHPSTRTSCSFPWTWGTHVKAFLSRLFIASWALQLFDGRETDKQPVAERSR